MKLVFIYGPPAVGKLTVAKIIAGKTKYKLFHNHLTVDLLSPIFQWGSKPFEELNEKLRLMIFKKGAEENINGIIFTFVYAQPEDDKFVKKVVKIIKEAKGEVCFVQLICNKKDLLERVKHNSRKQYKKIDTEEKLNDMLSKWSLFTPIKNQNNLIIDTTKLQAEETAQEIISHYKLT